MVFSYMKERGTVKEREEKERKEVQECFTLVFLKGKINCLNCYLEVT